MEQPPNAIPPIIPPEPMLEPGGDSGPRPARARPWGFWITIAWTLLIGAGYVLAQGVVLIIYTGPEILRSDRVPKLEEISSDGLLLALSTIFSAPVGVGLCVLFAWLRRGIRVRAYLGWCRPGGRAVLRWGCAMIAFGAASDLVTTLVLKKPLVPEVMVEIYRNAGNLPLLWLAIVVAGPVAEEFMFRGFLFAGLQGADRSRWRDFAAVVATSGVWAGIHLQYDAYGVATIFLGGILLGYARVRTGSLPLCILLHGLMNLVATVEVTLMLA